MNRGPLLSEVLSTEPQPLPDALVSANSFIAYILCRILATFSTLK